MIGLICPHCQNSRLFSIKVQQYYAWIDSVYVSHTRQNSLMTAGFPCVKKVLNWHAKGAVTLKPSFEISTLFKLQIGLKLYTKVQVVHDLKRVDICALLFIYRKNQTNKITIPNTKFGHFLISLLSVYSLLSFKSVLNCIHFLQIFCGVIFATKKLEEIGILLLLFSCKLTLFLKNQT